MGIYFSIFIIIDTIVLDISQKSSQNNQYKNCGGFNFMKISQGIKLVNMTFISLYPEITITGDENYTRISLLKKINDFQNIKYIVIACHTASSCIIDDLLKNNHLINNIRIFEPIVPTCQYIKKKKISNNSNIIYFFNSQNKMAC